MAYPTTQEQSWEFQAEFINAAANAGRKIGATMAAITMMDLLSRTRDIQPGEMAEAGTKWANSKGTKHATSKIADGIICRWLGS